MLRHTKERQKTSTQTIGEIFYKPFIKTATYFLLLSQTKRQGMWADFEDHFEAAQDAAHVRVIANITGLDITVWPPLPPLPVLPHNHTPAEQHAFEAELSVWTQNNVHTIPHAKHAIEMEYSDMHFRETLNEIYLKSDYSDYANDSVAFETLSLSFLYLTALPLYCRE